MADNYNNNTENENAIDTALDEIDADLIFDVAELKTFDEYENCEIELPNDLIIEDLDLEECVATIPTSIRFVDDKMVQDVFVDDHDDDKIQFSCENCKKPFKAEIHFVNHGRKCGR